MQIKKRKVKELIDALNYSIDYKVKNLFTLRAEKLGKNIQLIADSINNVIAEKNAEFAMTDDKGNFIHEEITITEKGVSKTEKTGNYKYTHERTKQRKVAVEAIWNETVDISVNVIPLNEKNEALYKHIFETYNAIFISLFADILLDIPVDAEGFVEEEFALQHIVNS